MSELLTHGGVVRILAEPVDGFGKDGRLQRWAGQLCLLNGDGGLAALIARSLGKRSLCHADVPALRGSQLQARGPLPIARKHGPIESDFATEAHGGISIGHADLDLLRAVRQRPIRLRGVHQLAFVEYEVVSVTAIGRDFRFRIPPEHRKENDWLAVRIQHLDPRLLARVENRPLRRGRKRPRVEHANAVDRGLPRGVHRCRELRRHGAHRRHGPEQACGLVHLKHKRQIPLGTKVSLHATRARQVEPLDLESSVADASGKQVPVERFGEAIGRQRLPSAVFIVCGEPRQPAVRMHPEAVSIVRFRRDIRIENLSAIPFLDDVSRGGEVGRAAWCGGLGDKESALAISGDIGHALEIPRLIDTRFASAHATECLEQLPGGREPFDLLARARLSDKPITRHAIHSDAAWRNEIGNADGPPGLAACRLDDLISSDNKHPPTTQQCDIRQATLDAQPIDLLAGGRIKPDDEPRRWRCHHQLAIAGIHPSRLLVGLD